MKLTPEMLESIEQHKATIKSAAYNFTRIMLDTPEILLIDGEIDHNHFFVKMFKEAVSAYEAYAYALQALGYEPCRSLY